MPVGSGRSVPSEVTLDALADHFGEPKHIASASMPFVLGGPASVAVFDIDGAQLGVTFELSGDGGQPPNGGGSYELAIAGPAPADSQIGLISRLAHYTLDTVIEAGDTMDLPREQRPRRSRLTGLLFSALTRIEVAGHHIGILLAVGITRDELDAIRRSRESNVVERLSRSTSVPLTEWRRRSVLDRR